MIKSQREKGGGGPDGRDGGGANVGTEMDRLRRRFELFRGGHKPGSRIPDELRAAALAALDRGASEGDLRRACQATAVQLRHWQAQLRRGTAEVRARAEPVARVFDVVDEPAGLERTLNGEPAELELRLGRWAVRISQLGG